MLFGIFGAKTEEKRHIAPLVFRVSRKTIYFLGENALLTFKKAKK